MKRAIILFLCFTLVSCVPSIKKPINDSKTPPTVSLENDQEVKKTEDVEQKEEPSIIIDTTTLKKEKIGWGLTVTTNETEPGIPATWKTMLNKYNGFYIGPINQKVVYLTFDCGYEAGYTSKMMDILKENKVPAIFFIVGHYINTSSDLVKKMHENGFLIGNHSVNHPSFPALTESEIKKETEELDKRIIEITGVRPHYFRPPSGEFSEFSLGVISNLGYKTIFWSLAYRDWIPLPGGAEESYQTVMDRIHPGAVILMHAVSKDNLDALQRIIDGIRSKGYEFALLNF